MLAKNSFFIGVLSDFRAQAQTAVTGPTFVDGPRCSFAVTFAILARFPEHLEEETICRFWRPGGSALPRAILGEV
jgi:hypothetical protein